MSERPAYDDFHAPPQKQVDPYDLPADHPYYADHSGLAQTVELDEVTILTCIAELPELLVERCVEDAKYNRGVLHAKARLEALLPKKDRAKELAEEYDRSPCKEGDRYYGTVGFHANLEFARWLESEGKLR